MADMLKKIQEQLIRLYMFDAGGDVENLMQRDYDIITDALLWRFAAYERMLIDVKQNRLSPEEVIAAVSFMSIRRQIEDEIALYQEEMTTLSANSGEFGEEDPEVDENEFVDRVVTLTLAILVLTLILGSVPSESDLTEEQRILVGASRLVLQANAGDVTGQTEEQLEQYLAGKAILENEDLLNDGLTTEQQTELAEQMRIAEESALGLFADISDGKFQEEGGDESLIFRILLWVGTAIFMFSLAQTFRADDPNLMWVYNPIKDHCRDCIRLNGQVHSALAWRASGWVPRGRMLECKGFHCGCNFFETDEEEVGNF